PLWNPLLEVQVNGVLGQHAGIFKNYRTDRCLATPVGQLLIRFARCAQRVERRGPARIRFCPTVERRERPDSSAVFICRLGQRLYTKELEGARKRIAKRRGFEGGPCARPLQ